MAGLTSPAVAMSRMLLCLHKLFVIVSVGSDGNDDKSVVTIVVTSHCNVGDHLEM